MKTATGARRIAGPGSPLRAALSAIVLCGILLGSPRAALADFGWPQRAGGTALDMASAVATDTLGNVYMIGFFQGTATFGDVTLASRGSNDVVIGKIDAGGVWQWAVQAGGAGDDHPYGIAVDADGDVYVSGTYASADARFGNVSLPAAAGYDVFVAKYTTAGSLVWANSATGSGEDVGMGVAVNEDGGVYVAGYTLQSSLSFPGSAAVSLPNPFVSAEDWNYCLVWPGYNGPCGRFQGDCDSDLQCQPGLVCGHDTGAWFGLNATFDVCMTSADTTTPHYPNYDGFVAKLSAGGEWQWARRIGGSALSDDKALAVAVITKGTVTAARHHIYVAGKFMTDLQLTNTPASGSPNTRSVASAGATRQDLFVAKLVEEGEPEHDVGNPQPKLDPDPSWFWIADSVNATAADEMWAAGLTVDADGNIYVAGGYKGHPRLTAAALPDSGGRTAGFAARLFDNGNSFTWLWAKASGSDVGAVETVAVTTDTLTAASRGVYVSGSFTGTMSYDAPALEPNLTARGGRDIFVLKFAAADGAVQWGTRGGLAAEDWQESYPTLSGGHHRGGIAADATGTTFVAGGFAAVTSLIEGETMALNGTDQAVHVTADVSETDYAVSLWIKTTEADRGIFSVVSGVPIGSGGHDRHLYLDASGNLVARVYNNEVIKTTGYSLADGQWHHIVHTFGGVAGGQILYVDGLERAAGSMSASAFTWQTGYAIGFSLDAVSNYFKGKIADVRISGAKTLADVQAIYAAGQPAESNGKLLFAAGSRDMFLGTLTPNGHWRSSEEWVVGQIVPRPAGAVAYLPEFPSVSDSGNCFYWSESEKQLYSVWRCGAVIKWRIDSTHLEKPDRIVTVGASDWPAQPQVHVAGVPVDLQPATTGFAYSSIMRKDNDANDTQTTSTGGKIYRASLPGYSVLLYGDGGPDLTTHPAAFEVVKTVPWDTAGLLSDGAACTIGQRITDASHTDPEGRNGFVFFENAYYDGTGNDRAYDRATRTGPIIPVNRLGSYRQNTSATLQAAGRDLVVVWFATNDKSIAWPVRPVRYDCAWPANPLKIVIASELGSDVYGQPPLDPAVYPEAQIYRQEKSALPGYNPNEEHASLFPSATGNGFDAAFALRSDLSNSTATPPVLPYVLLKYRKPADGNWAMLVYKVLATDSNYPNFTFHGTAGTPIFPPYPVRLLNGCIETNPKSEGGPFWKDKVNKQYWARSAGQVTVYYYYPLLAGWDYPGNPASLPNTFTGNPGDCVPWLNRLTAGSSLPIEVNYSIAWPADVPMLQVGETLLTAKRGLPDITNQAATEVIFEGLEPGVGNNPPVNQPGKLVQLIEPLSTRWVALAKVPDTIGTQADGGLVLFSDLPFHLQQRVVYDPINKMLGFRGYFDGTVLGDPLLLLNVMSGTEKTELLALSTGTDQIHTGYQDAVNALFYKTRNPRDIDQDGNGVADNIEAGTDTLIGFQDYYTTNASGEVTAGGRPPDDVHDHKKEPLQALGSGHALSAGAAKGAGYVTLAFNNDPSLGSLPVSLKVVRVDCGPYLGEIKVIQSDNVFDEKLTLRHSGDFGGNPELLTFEWYYHPDEGGFSPSPPPSPQTSQLHGWLPFAMTPKSGVGANSIDINGASIQTLSDNWFYVRYKGYQICGNNTTPTAWAGAPGSTAVNPSAQLAEGWIKRVVRALNAYEQRVKDFHAAPAATYASMLLQAGERYEGDVAMNNDPDNLNSMGLIAAYETVLRRGMTLSIEGTPPIDYAPANAALLLAASRISDFYMLLGNEAYADAADPTIGFGTVGGDYGTAASSIFAFQNQVDSLLEEELTLLRGKDTRMAPPVYNRLPWNFTTGEGEIAYSQVYGITDQNVSGVIDEFDARILYPQGHGDAWGHYLTAMTTYYKLLRHPYYSWDPRAEAVLVGGAPVMVDYLDERKFARAAAAKARAGAEIVDLTYRINYVDDPAGQWQGYKDTDARRAWGLAEWGRRAGQGAYFDWVVANAILPAVDTDPDHVQLIQKIDRNTVLDLLEIPAQYTVVQGQLDKADAGLSPLGLAKGVVPFDINPQELDPAQGPYARTYFEQIAERAQEALGNAVTVFDYASRMSQSLRRNQDSLSNFSTNVWNEEQDYKNRLVEIFGYPYFDDIGPAGTYADGYDGPDLLHYMWVDSSELTGDAAPTILTTSDGSTIERTVSKTFKLAYKDSSGVSPAFTLNMELAKVWNLPGTVTYNFSLDTGGIVKPDYVKGKRRAEGELQRALSDVYRARSSFQQAKVAYDNGIAEIKAKVADLVREDQMNADLINLKIGQNATNIVYNVVIGVLNGASRALAGVGNALGSIVDRTAECLPKENGLANDFTSVARCALRIQGVTAKVIFDALGEVFGIAKDSVELSKEDAEKAWEVTIERAGKAYEMTGKFSELEKLFREEPIARLQAFEAGETAKQAVQQYLSVLAEGQRTIDKLVTFRKQTAVSIQQYRYQDMTFRVFRNDAIQKYRAQFDLAARYVYLAATAYDYETNLLGFSSVAGRRFLTDIVRQRALGEVIDGRPVAGTPGVADPLARLQLNFRVLKGQLGLNNPQTETNRFSLRSELFRVDAADPAWPDPVTNPAGNASAALWRDALETHRVADLWDVPEFRRYCRSFAPEEAGPQPGLVVPFSTTVSYGLNFFGWPLGGGDSAYDPTNFSTRVRSAGVWFGDYDIAGLSNTPRVYLVPAGMDVLRSPNGDDWEFREWQVVDQKLPVPFKVGASDLTDPGWIPLNDTLSDVLGGVRKFSSFRAYHDGGEFDPYEMVSDTRLVGRSVWNTRWLLIIPGATLHYDPDVGLDRFVEKVSDVKLFFQTYGYSGN